MGADIRLTGVSKRYQVFPDRVSNLMHALGLGRLVPSRAVQEFWALRDIDLEVPASRRVGLIGRNGAGKTTLLKLITGNIAPTEGQVEVRGNVQALLDVGAGFHPEFTGYENVNASLAYQGLSRAELARAIRDIAEFTELGGFLQQPFKTYSAGMQARLTFATATVLRPDILIVDEILGAGDAYFAAKSAERMKNLVEDSGASVLLVSHGLDQILRYCDQCLWIERGRIVKRGDAIDVVNAYQSFIQTLEDRRLRRRNARGQTAYRTEAEAPVDALQVAVVASSSNLSGACDVAEVAIVMGSEEEVLHVGAGQDASWAHTGVVVLEGSAWSEPKRRGGGGFFRSLVVQPPALEAATGFCVFHMSSMPPSEAYDLRIKFRAPIDIGVSVSCSLNGRTILSMVPAQPTGEWTEWRISLGALDPQALPAPDQQAGDPAPEGDGAVPAPRERTAGAQTGTRWPGEGSVLFEKVQLLDGKGSERAVFHAGDELILRMLVRARRSGAFRLIPGVTMTRLDGVFVSNFVGPIESLSMEPGSTRAFEIRLPSLLLGNGRFVLSVSLFEGSVVGESRYDLIARACEFDVVGNESVYAAALFRHPVEWSSADSNEAESSAATPTTQ